MFRLLKNKVRAVRSAGFSADWQWPDFAIGEAEFDLQGNASLTCKVECNIWHRDPCAKHGRECGRSGYRLRKLEC